MVYLTQTDTTVGFLSTSARALYEVKQRDQGKPFLQVCSSFQKLKALAYVPKAFRKMIRRANKSTFIYPNKKAIRVVKDGRHHRFVKPFDYLLSTSANLSGKGFDEQFAKDSADMIIYQSQKLQENTPSRLYKLHKQKMRRLR